MTSRASAERRASAGLSNVRWGVVALLLLGFAALLRASATVDAMPPWLGVRVGSVDGQAVVEWVQPGGHAWDAGVRPGAIVVAIDGAPGRDPSAAGTARQIDVRARSGEIVTASIDTSPVLRSARSRAIFRIIASAFLIVAGAVYVLAADRPAAAAVLAFGATTAVTLVASTATPSGLPLPLAAAFVGFLLVGLSMLALFLVFPVDRRRTSLGRGLLGAAGVATAALAAAYGAAALWSPNTYEPIQRWLSALVGAELLASIALVGAAIARTPSGSPERRAVRLLAAGTLLAFAPVAGLALLPRGIGGIYLLSPEDAALATILMPIGLAGGVLLRGILGIERLIRRGLVALAVWGALLVTYSLVLDALESWGDGWPALAGVVGSTAFAVVIVAGTFWPAQARIRRTLEQALFRDVYDYAQTVQDLGAELVRLRGVQAIVDRTLDRLGRTMDLTWAAIVVNADGPAVVYRWGTPPAGLTDERVPAEIGQAALDPGRPTVVMGGAATAIALPADERVLGVLLAGPKRRDVELSPQDTSLLASVAPLVGACLRNAGLIRALEEQVVALEALSARLMSVQEEERHSLALDLHDDPLQQAIALARALREEGGGNLHHADSAQSVADALRAISIGLRPPLLDDFGLPAALRHLVGQTRARADQAVVFTMRPADDESFGRLHRDLEVALYRVAQEAITNSIKHAQAETIRIGLERVDRHVTLRVGDDGRGFNPAASVHLANGRPTPLGILGMHERLRRWGGRVTVESEPGLGAAVIAHVEDHRAS